MRAQILKKVKEVLNSLYRGRLVEARYYYKGNLIGYCTVTRWFEMHAAVHPYFRGKGLGTKLFKKVIAIAKNKNIPYLLSAIYYDNAPTLHIHEKLGYKKIGVSGKSYLLMLKLQDKEVKAKLPKIRKIFGTILPKIHNTKFYGFIHRNLISVEGIFKR